MKRSIHPAIHAIATIGLFAMAVSIGAAQLPIPDPAYGGNGDGIARIAVDASVDADDSNATHAVVQADGRLVLVGTARTVVGLQTQFQVVLARIDTAGHLDTSFGADHDGLFRSAFAGFADDIAQTGDGKLVYAGHDSGDEAMIVGRLHADGTPDTGFVLSGRRLIAPSALFDGAAQGDLTTVLPLSNGKTLALGWVGVPSTPWQAFSCAMRLLADGSTDTSFGTAGRTCVGPVAGVVSEAFSGRVLADGRILLAGGSQHSGGSSVDMSVTRLGADGVLDTSFGPAHDGWAFVGFDQGGELGDAAQAIAVDGEGRILLAGYLEGVQGHDIGIARLLPDGQPDASFGSQGRVQIALDLGGLDHDDAHSIAALPDGGILVGGSADTADGPSVGVAILLKGDGQFDPRFGERGVFLQADPAAPPAAKVDTSQQILAGDYLYMIGGALNAGNRFDFAATRTVMPLFADSFESPDTARSAQP